MQISTTEPFERDYAALPQRIKDLTDNKLKLLLQSPRHPSLRIKKMEDPREIWEGRVTFQIKGDVYILRRIGTHDILRTP